MSKLLITVDKLSHGKVVTRQLFALSSSFFALSSAFALSCFSDAAIVVFPLLFLRFCVFVLFVRMEIIIIIIIIIMTVELHHHQQHGLLTFLVIGILLSLLLDVQ